MRPSLKKKSSLDELFSFRNQLYMMFGIFGFALFSVGAGMYLDKADTSGYQPFEAQGELKGAISMLQKDWQTSKRMLEDLDGKLSAPEDSRRLYMLAVLDQKEQDYEGALKNFSQVKLKKIPFLADRVLLHTAEIQAHLGNEKAVMNLCKRIIDEYPGSVSLAGAQYELAKSYLRQSEFSQAKKLLEELREKFPDSEQSIGALYYLGQNSDDSVEKMRLWQKYLTEAPKGMFSGQIANYFETNLNSLSSTQKSILGLYYYNSEDKEKKNKAYEFLSQDFNYMTWYPTAVLGIDINKIKTEEILGEGLKRFGKYNNFEDGISLFIRNFSVSARDALIENLINIYPDKKDYLLWKKATYQSGSQKIATLERLVRECPSGLYAGSASSDLFWNAFKANNYASAQRIAESQLKNYRNSYHTAKVAFWLGWMKEKEGKQSEAFQIYKKAYEDYPASYYGFRAKAKVLKMSNSSAMNFWGVNTGVEDSKIAEDLDMIGNWAVPLPNDELKQLNPTIQELFSLGLWKEAFSLLPSGYENKFPALKAWYIARMSEQPSEAIKLAESILRKGGYSFDEKKEYWLLSYPFMYWKEVQEYSRKNGVDPILVLSIMRQESRFQEKALSRSGAIGLCQLMPATASEVLGRVGLPPVSDKSALFSPDLNIRLGSRYLSDLVNKFEGKLYLAVGAYNGGPGAMGRWKASLGDSDAELFIESIPYFETSNYIVKVMENYWVYKNLARSYYGAS